MRMSGGSSCSIGNSGGGGTLGRSNGGHGHGDIDRKPLLLNANNNHVIDGMMNSSSSGMLLGSSSGGGGSAASNIFKMSEEALFAMSNGDHAAAFDLIFATAAQVSLSFL